MEIQSLVHILGQGELFFNS